MRPFDLLVNGASGKTRTRDSTARGRYDAGPTSAMGVLSFVVYPAFAAAVCRFAADTCELTLFFRASRAPSTCSAASVLVSPVTSEISPISSLLALPSVPDSPRVNDLVSLNSVNEAMI